MRVSRWSTSIGVIESLLALWALAAAGWDVMTVGVDSVASTVSAAALLIISAMLLIGGVRLIRHDARGMSLSMTTLKLLTVKLALPGFVWCVSLGFSVDIVLYAGGPGVPDGQLTAVWIGHTEFPGYLAVNLLPLSLLGALYLVRRATATMATAEVSGTVAGQG